MPLLYSIGYGRRDNLPILNSLMQRGLQLVDIRFKPWSNIPSFRRSELAATYGIQYSHIGSLGNINYKGGPIELLNPQSGIRALAAILEQRDAIILCGCSAVQTCHRLTVANLLAASMSDVTIIEL